MRSAQRVWPWAMAGLGLCMAVAMVFARARSRMSREVLFDPAMRFPVAPARNFMQMRQTIPRGSILVNVRDSAMSFPARFASAPLAVHPYESMFRTRMPHPVGHMLEEAGSSSSHQVHAEEHRCNGLLHACVNWMSLNAGKMRVIVYEGGSWCTDDEVMSQACYNEPKTIQEDHLYDIPSNGETISDDIWNTMLKTCPFLSGCSKPDTFSNTESSDELKQTKSAVLEYHEARQGMLKQIDSCCIDRQQAKLAHLKR